MPEYGLVIGVAAPAVLALVGVLGYWVRHRERSRRRGGYVRKKPPGNSRT